MQIFFRTFYIGHKCWYQLVFRIIVQTEKAAVLEDKRKNEEMKVHVDFMS